MTMKSQQHLNTIFYLSLLLLAGMLVACTAETPESAAPADVELITLDRQPCFGFCPIYTLAIHDDGRVEFNGVDYVEATGPQSSTIDPASVQALGDEMVEAGYLTWDDAYMAQDVTDLPYVISSITFSDGTTKTIEHYHGDFSAPEALTAMEQLIDQTANTTQWVGEPPP
jgi:hypothetical protein